MKNYRKINADSPQVSIFHKFKNSILLSATICLLGCSQVDDRPDTKQIEHFDEYHGVKVLDSYRWLENFTSEEVRAWVDEQNLYTQSFLTNEFREEIKKDLESIWTSEYLSIPFVVKDRTFFYFNNGHWQQNKLMVKDCDSCEERVLIDPNLFSIDGTVSMASASVSPDSNWIAFSISDGGSDWRTWRIMNINSGQVMDEELNWSKFSSAEWSPDSLGFFYTKYPEPNGEELSAINGSPKILYHLVGSLQKEDEIIIQDQNDPLLSWSLTVSDDGKYKILYTSKGTDERNLISIAKFEDQQLIPIVDQFIASYSFIDSSENNLWFLTNHMAPNGKVVLLDFNNLAAGFEEVIPEGENSINSVNMINDSFVVNYLNDTFSDVRYFDTSGSIYGSLEMPEMGTISGLKGKKEDAFSYFSFTNFIQPLQIYKLNLETNSYEKFWEEKLNNFTAEAYESKMVFYPSKDGTMIPLHIAHKKNLVINNSSPVLLYGYGGFNISLLPRFSKRYLAWMNQGGVFALANLRGGSEFGREWHDQGMLLNKQNVFDDFAYAAKFLHKEAIGSPQSTVIQGRSNGGLLVGATMLQNPELFGFAIPQVGVMDMLRFNKFTIGWAWESDYGSPEDLNHFQNLYSYSPYHNINQGICYPPTLITTSDRDDRVVPSHSYKFAAKMQRHQSCKNPILLRVETRAGHGSGIPRDKEISEIADIYGAALNLIN
ncbi:prolyl oligopeptidase family serine peptidase [Gammaproteobacteria bacterium]|nr:prolyl oligopeptidase family serine peptidase [Gammaproteobacteria bacterium]